VVVDCKYTGGFDRMRKGSVTKINCFKVSKYALSLQIKLGCSHFVSKVDGDAWSSKNVKTAVA